jgi:hypothetical protein
MIKAENNRITSDKSNDSNLTFQKPKSFSSMKQSYLSKKIHPQVLAYVISDKYKTLSLFDQTQNRKKSKSIKINPRLIKYSYIDWIEIDNKSKRHPPSVGKYNLMKT